ncbi:DUF4040 family protein [Arthrobacter sp. H20]|uniref:DUF4040 family protein n=1 Tax=Arthrobacter sp. H20 TaxID=1267981 RepID=UPI0006855269|nr:DUF4040 family protein [Arthrobacter sp. H20]
MILESLALTLTGCVAAAFFGRQLRRNLGYLLALPLLGAAGLLVAAADRGVTEQVWSWIPSLGVTFALRLDGLSLLFGLLVTVVGAAVLVYSARYLARSDQTGFYVLMNVFALAMLLLVLADDVVLLFVAWEATTLCSFFLIARSGDNAREPAIRTLLVTALGGLALLGAAVTMSVAAGTTRIGAILDDPFWTDDPALTAWVASLLAVAAFTKSAQFPFQGWLPDSMVAITPVSAYLHAAAMVKAGIYLLLLFSPVLSGHPLWSTLLITSGAITALVGGFAALQRTDLKELLAYSTTSQLGLLVLLIGIGTPAALKAAVVHTVAHALFKAVLFMVVGIIDHRAGTRDIRKLAALHVRMPVTVSIAAIAALSMAGVPPLLGFVSKESMFAAFLETPGHGWVPVVVTIAGVTTAVLTLAYAGRFVLGALGGRSGHGVREAASLFWMVPALGAVGGLVLGVAPGLLDQVVGDATSSSAGAEVGVTLELWHGLNAPLALSAVAIASGTVLILFRRNVFRLTRRIHSPVRALNVVDGTRAGIIRCGETVSRLSGGDAPRRHLMIPMVCLVGIAALSANALGPLPQVVGNPTHPLDWILVTLVLVGTVATVLARTRVAAIVVIGVIGFAMTLWFFWLGAADVALTQLLVEILTICVLVLVLRRLPRKFSKDTRRRRISSLGVAVAAGVATLAATLAFTGRRELSPVAEYYLRNGETETGGANIVNTILVDFRALDTLGELAVLGIAGVAIAVILSARRTVEKPADDVHIDEESPLADAHHNSVFARAFIRWARPLTIVISLILLWRGHQEPGGGFIAALVAGAGFALLYLAAHSDEAARSRWPYLLLIGLGVAIAALVGFVGYLEGSFLQPLQFEILGLKLTSALIFDVGVYLTVIGFILAALNLLGVRQHPAPLPTDPTDSDAPGIKEGSHS